MTSRIRRPVTLTIALLLFAMLPAGTASADRGVAVNVGEMTVKSMLLPGGGYSLPVIAVINTGSEQSDYALSITFLTDQEQRRPNPDWFSFSPERFTLGPGESRDVVVSIKVPGGARPGEYFALVRAHTVSGAEGGTSVGVAAATKLTFNVASSGWLETRWRSLNEFLEDYMPWTALLPVALVFAFVARKWGRLPFRLRIERR